uniref:Lactosylceramide alpha-2,3-sialyltransferase n=2 Tax=Gadus morhua TaxID=8049 RepID=A0A8C4ZSG0_GADMO
MLVLVTYKLFQKLTSGYFMFNVTQNQIKSRQNKSNQIKWNQIKSRVTWSPDILKYCFLFRVHFPCLVLFFHFSHATDKNQEMSRCETVIHVLPSLCAGGGGGGGADAAVAMVTLSFLMEDESRDDRSPLLLEAPASTALAAVPQRCPGGSHLDTFLLSRRNNLGLSLALLLGCYAAILVPAYSHADRLAPMDDGPPAPPHLVPAYSHADRLAPVDDGHPAPPHLALLNLSADLLSGPCLPQWGRDRLRTLSCSGGLLGLAPVFVEGPQEEVEGGGGRRAPWELPPPLGLRGSERQAARALASLPRPGRPPWLQGGGCRRCVVVGSGGVLHGSHLGSSIDQYDVIIRLNAAPVGCFQRDAGSRTTIRLVYPEAAPASPEEYRTTSVVALVVFKSLDLDWLTSVITKRPLSFWSKLWFWRKVVEEIPLTAEHFRILNPEIIHQTGRALHSYAPSGGTRVPTLGASAVVLALQLCDQVSLAGFGYDLRHPGARLHYYEALRMDAMKGQVVHDIGSEKLFLRDLVSSGAVTDLTGAL